MLFPSIEFGLFFAIVLCISWGLARANLHTVQKWFLLAASLFFYAVWSIGFALLLVAASFVAYVVALATDRMTSPAQRKWAIGLGIAGMLGLLGYFKYYNFLLATLMNLGLFHLIGVQPPFVETVIPIAISFFTFHAISYMVDCYRGQLRATRSLTDVMLYISFFPHLVAGPIVRAADFIPQLKVKPVATVRPYADALFLIVIGLFKKVVLANYLAVAIVDPVFTAPSQFGAGDLILATLAYAYQIYFDFSAYTNIAIGVAALLGYRFPENFDQPYRSLSPREFWTRWHISLSTWLRDYLYIPLGGSRFGAFNTMRNLMITMVLGGLWHGANATFVIWGTLHGVALVINHWWMRTAIRERLSPSVVYRALCFVGMTIFICATWVYFRSADLASAHEVFAGMVQRPTLPTLTTPFLLALLVIGVIGQLLPPAWATGIPRAIEGWAIPVQIGAFALAMVVLVMLAPGASAPFIYFQF